MKKGAKMVAFMAFRDGPNEKKPADIDSDADVIFDPVAPLADEP